jgi:O-antigen ligase
MLGGGTTSGLRGDLLLQFVAILALAGALWKWLDGQRSPPALVLLGCVTLLAIPLLQLIPLPPSVWAALPQRAVAAEVAELASETLSWAPLSMVPQDTWSSVFSLIVPVALFLTVVQLGYPARRVLTLLVVCAAVFSVAMGLLQVAFGVAPSLESQVATGVFANRNHFAALLYSSFLFVMVWASYSIIGVERAAADPLTTGRRHFLVFLSVTAIIAFIAGIAMSRSRAGVAIGICAMAASYWLVMLEHRRDRSLTSAKVLGGAVLFGFLLVAQFALVGLVDRFAADPLDDPRLSIGQSALHAAGELMPAGAGAGTFMRVFPLFEGLDDVRAGLFVNRAHNDWLELVIEFGAIGIAALLGFLCWFAARAYSAWRHVPDSGQPVDLALRRAASVIIALLLLHSFVDYPLRTGGMSAVFALSCAMLIVPPRAPASPLQPGSKARLAALESSIAEFGSPSAMGGKRAPSTWENDQPWPEVWR